MIAMAMAHGNLCPCRVPAFDTSPRRLDWARDSARCKRKFATEPDLRPFLEVAIGGVIANSGDWSKETAESVYGGMARGAIGVEYPFADRYFASGSVGYRLIATENPLRNQAEEDLNSTYLGIEPSAGDYAEDAHLVTFGVGVGVEL